jgi:hypothetical protein
MISIIKANKIYVLITIFQCQLCIPSYDFRRAASPHLRPEQLCSNPRLDLHQLPCSPASPFDGVACFCSPPAVSAAGVPDPDLLFFCGHGYAYAYRGKASGASVSSASDPVLGVFVFVADSYPGTALSVSLVLYIFKTRCNHCWRDSFYQKDNK